MKQFFQALLDLAIRLWTRLQNTQKHWIASRQDGI